MECFSFIASSLFEWPFDGSTTETVPLQIFCLFKMDSSSDRLMDRLLKHYRCKCSNYCHCSSDRLMDRLLKLVKFCWTPNSIGSSDRLMDRLLKHFWDNISTLRRSSSDRLMDRLLKLIFLCWMFIQIVRVTVWWIDYWNWTWLLLCVLCSVRVTVWWIDYWNKDLLFVLLLGEVRVTVWWIDYWNVTFSILEIASLFEWPFDGSTTETLVTVQK